MKNNILLKNLMFYGFHGAFEHERELGQRYYLDVQREVDFDKAALSDDLSDAVNYVEIYNLIKDIVENKRFCLMEALAANVGDSILLEFDQIIGVSVKVRKPAVPIAGGLDYVQIEVLRRRS